MRLHRVGSLFSLLAALMGALLSSTPAWAATATDLAVRFTAVSFRNGTLGLYTVTVTNRGPGATSDTVTARLALPAGFHLASEGSNGFSCANAGGVVDCTRSTPLSSGSSTSFQVRVAVCSQFTRVSTTVSVVYAGDSTPTNSSYTRVTSVRQGPCLPSPTATTVLTATPTPTVTLGSPVPTSSPTQTASPSATRTPVPVATDLKLTKTSLGAARVGQPYNYTLYVANLGNAATNSAFTVVDTLPTGLSFVAGSGTGWTCNAAGQLVTCTYEPALPGAATASLTLTVHVGDAAYPTITNRATLSYNGDADISNNTSNRPTTVRR